MGKILNSVTVEAMDKSFQDYSGIQDFHRKSASKCWIREIKIGFPIYIQCV